MNPSKHKMSVLAQICKLIPGNLVSKLSREHGVDKQWREFSPWSHVTALMYSQLSHAMSLNDVCDALRNHAGALAAIREATPPSRNGFSHANRERNADMAEDLFWQVQVYLQSLCSDFGMGRQYCGLPRRFKRTINVVDSSTIRLFANCLDWAKHRRRKAAAKMHLRLDLQTFLPNFIIVKSAGTHDSTEAAELCASAKAGEIVIFDKAYVDFKHLFKLHGRDVLWVTRAKDNMQYEAVGQHTAPKGKILSDERIRLASPKTFGDYPEELRRVEAVVKVNGKNKIMVFITNNFSWSPNSIADLYKARWSVEVFFKEIKQTLQIADFLGYNENAVRWQIWTAMLVYILLRFIAYQGKWTHSFTRLFTMLRGVLWSAFDMFSVLNYYGTAHGTRMRATPEQSYLPGMTPG